MAHLAEQGRIVERIEFAAGIALEYVLATGSCLQASLEKNRILVTAPEAAVAQWASSEQVGMEGEQQTGGATLSILIEKDFQCSHGAMEADAYPNPEHSFSTPGAC